MKLLDIKVGDTVRRLMCETIKVDIVVTEIDDDYIYCHPPKMTWPRDACWKFRLDNGYEVDEDLGWDGVTRMSYRSQASKTWRRYRLRSCSVRW